MSVFRFGRALVRSIFRNVDAVKEASAKVVPVSRHAYTTTLVRSGCNFPTQATGRNPVSAFSQALFQEFITARGGLVTSTASIFKGAASMRMMRQGNGRGPMFAFLGLVCTNFGVKSFSSAEDEQFLQLYQWIQHGVNASHKTTEQCASSHKGLRLKDYKIGHKLGNRSCNSAVYAASRKDEKLAIKMLFNYSASSQSRALWKEFSKESAVLSICQDESTAHTEGPKYTHLPTHVNILPVLHTFVDDMPHLPDAQDSYPAALPARHGGLGRNRTMFLVMPRFTHTLESYLASLGRPPEVQTSCLLLLQLLNGLVHLQEHQVAHRDLKSDNLLLDTSVYPPRLVICDFGCCLADTRQGLKLPLLTDETDRGGNSMLMAPEVSTAESGPGASIDYTKADVWSAGAIAYEMFGERNPFSHGGAESRTYSDKELPTIDSAPPELARLVKLLLRRNPQSRLSADHAATALYVYLNAPSWWWCDTLLVTHGDVLRWLLMCSLRCLAAYSTSDWSGAISQIHATFLKTASVEKVLDAVRSLRLIRQH
ncbi:serine/threonine-protein kinase Pink1, mitochondrial isoform X2 [Nematostella vectensis]|uniref:serine/threonine-protein kinase Pink1, mitochondrial isoform X2 n=1 Tax=Nematostella vectensis TaxID=45351 RepID=UPI00207721AB|nr:serine/threonine-protein kinase Pink1, mitochondrial isoform X2 [Nematostella vectensis]